MSPLLEARQLSKRYQEGSITVAAVNSVSFAVDQGQIALIIGPSGSGKSTLLSMLGCILRPTSGAVLLAGHEVSGLSDRDLPIIRGKYFGFVFQAFHLFPFLTAQENVETALRLRKIPSSARRARSIDFLTRCGLDERMSFYPASLSGGEKQRVAIARALVGDPYILIADEPTASLDFGKWRSGLRHAASLRERNWKSRHHGEPRSKGETFRGQSLQSNRRPDKR